MSVFETQSPIFVRGLSRSGGTLMVTLLDSHPDVAMSYELYPHLLLLGPEIDMSLVAKSVSKSTNKTIKKNAPTKAIGTFAIRCNRSGLSLENVGELIEQVATEGFHFSNLNGRLRMIEKCAQVKMRNEGKKRWGMKCAGKFSDYLEAWPKSQFLNMLRDGRDVLASQLHTGNFKNSPAEVANGWMKTHEKFANEIETRKINGIFVRYESIATNPEKELRQICDFLNLPFRDVMLRHSEQKLTVFSVSHLSGDRINTSIDNKSIGRWQRDVTVRQLEEFLEVAGATLNKYGYK